MNLFSNLCYKENRKLHQENQKLKLNYKCKPNFNSLLSGVLLPTVYGGIYRRNEERRERLRIRPNCWPNRKNLLISLEIKLKIGTKLLAQQKRSSDKIGDKVGDMDKICPKEKIF